MWSQALGKKGVNRVRVYEREPDGPLWLEWSANGQRVREPAGKSLGQIITEKKLALKIARILSEQLLTADDNKTAVKILGSKAPRTLKELLTAYHDAREISGPDGWSAHHKINCRHNRDYWLAALGPSTRLTDITPVIAARAVRVSSKKNSWKSNTERQYLGYLKTAFTFAHKKLKWITEEHNLSDLDLPRVRKSVGSSYSEEELGLLLPACLLIDLRLATAAYIADCTGRRLNSIRSLRVTDYEVRTLKLPGGKNTQVGVLIFRAEKDKAGKTGIAPVSIEAKALIQELLTKPVVIKTGYLFPQCEDSNLDTLTLKQRSRTDRPMSNEWLIELLHRAETLAGVAHIPGRAFHGMKRGMVTAGLSIMNPDTVSRLTGTRLDTLRENYMKDDLTNKLEGVLKLSSERARRRRVSGKATVPVTVPVTRPKTA